jgi:hypothetical protein
MSNLTRITYKNLMAKQERGELKTSEHHFSYQDDGTAIAYVTPVNSVFGKRVLVTQIPKEKQEAAKVEARRYAKEEQITRANFQAMSEADMDAILAIINKAGCNN